MIEPAYDGARDCAREQKIGVRRCHAHRVVALGRVGEYTASTRRVPDAAVGDLGEE